MKFDMRQMIHDIFYRSGVAGALPQTRLSLIHSFIPSLTQSVILCENIFRTPSLPNHKSYEAEIWKEGSPPPPDMCHVSCVTCQVSHVMYQYMYIYTFFSGKTSRRMVFYPVQSKYFLTEILFSNFFFALQEVLSSRRFLEDPGKARGWSTNTCVTH